MSDRRFVLGLTGPPGAGKSTLAADLVAVFGEIAALVPMDGFHRRHAELKALGRADRKGAPDTFDVDAYVELLTALRAAPDRTITAPAFDRELGEPVPAAIVVRPSHRVVLTEGNYLLHVSGGWERVRPLLDACWYVELDDAVRVGRLIARHVEFGRTPSDAAAWVTRSDEANARLIAAMRHRADRIVTPADDVHQLAAELIGGPGR